MGLCLRLSTSEGCFELFTSSAPAHKGISHVLILHFAPGMSIGTTGATKAHFLSSFASTAVAFSIIALFSLAVGLCANHVLRLRTRLAPPMLVNMPTESMGPHHKRNLVISSVNLEL